jgi:hypothetical protein
MLIVGIIVIYNFTLKKNESKVIPSNGDNRYTINCEKITLLVDDKVVVELTGAEKEKMLEYFSDGAILEEYDVNEKIDDSYNITLDFNNGITTLYMREKDNYVYFFKRQEDNFRNEIKAEVHDEIMKLIEENK